MNETQTTQDTDETTRTESVESTPRPAAATRSPKPKKKSSALLWIVGLVIGLGVAFAAAQYLGFFEQPNKDGDSAVQTDPSTVVATVNNVEITRGELDEKIAEVSASMPDGAAATDDAAFEFQVLDEIINIELLTQKAMESNLTVSDEEIDAELANLKQTLGGEESFTQQLTLAGLTEEELLENMRTELLIRKLLDQETELEDVTVTEAEVEAFYNEAQASAPEGQEIPPLAEAQEFIRAQLIQEKSAEIVNTYLDRLRDSVNIDVTLE